MAKPNYSGEKRRKELAKLAKKKEKAAKKAAGGSTNSYLDPEPETTTEPAKE